MILCILRIIMKTNDTYKSIVLNHLHNHVGEKVYRDELIKKYKLSKSRLSEVIKSIKDDGYLISSPPRSGYICLENNSKHMVLSDIKDSDLRQWTIIFLLSIYGKLSFTEILIKLLVLRDDNYDQMKHLINHCESDKPYDDANLIKNLRESSVRDFNYKNINVAKEMISVTALRKDLLSLRNQGLVAIKQNKHTTYQLTNKVPYIIPISGDSLFEFCQRYEEQTSSATDVEPLKYIYNRIERLINLEKTDINQHRFGKSANIASEQIDAFNRFIESSYISKQIEFDYRLREGIKHVALSVGILYYSIETGAFYILGENSNKEIEFFRLQYLENISETAIPNTEYHKEKYYKFYDEIFSTAYEKKSYKVKIVIQDFGNVIRRFSALTNIRKHSTLYQIPNPPKDGYSYIYEDTIRGLYDFARYLRGFGKSVIAIEPPELREAMITTYTHILERYEETNG